MSARYAVVHGRSRECSTGRARSRRRQRLGVAGWVRNLPDGTVELVVEGDDEAVERMLDWAGRGPSRAEVTGVDVEDRPEEGSAGFQQR